MAYHYKITRAQLLSSLYKQKARVLYSYLGPWAPHIFTDMACTLLKGVDTLSSNQIRADGFIVCQENAISRIFNNVVHTSYLGPWALCLLTYRACKLLKGVDVLTLSSNQIRAKWLLMVVKKMPFPVFLIFCQYIVFRALGPLSFKI